MPDIRFHAKHGDKQEVESLLASGASANAADYWGVTPLHEAAGGGHAQVVELLLANGANANAKTNAYGEEPDGSTPLHYAASRGYVEVAHALLANGADVNARNSNGSIPLYLASRRGSAELVKALLARGADANAVNHSLLVAAGSGRADVVKLLLANGADPNYFSGARTGNMPLHEAARRGSTEMVKALLAHGAHPNCVDIDGSTPLQIAKTLGMKEVVEILLSSEMLAAPPAIANRVGSPVIASGVQNAPPALTQLRYRGLTFEGGDEYSLVFDDKRIVRGIWYRDRDSIGNAARNRMVVAAARVNGFEVLASDYEETIVKGLGGVEALNSSPVGGFILWFGSSRKLLEDSGTTPSGQDR